MYSTVDQIDFENITLGTPKKKNDKYVSYLFHERDPLVVKSSKYIYKECLDNILTVKNDGIKSFSLFLSNFEQFIIEKIHDKSEKWFSGKKFSTEQISERFESCVKDDEMNFSKSNNISVYNNNNKEKSIKNIRKGDIIIFILHIKGIWITKDKIGLLTNVNQIKFFAKPSLKVEKMQDCVIEESDSDNSYEEESDTEESDTEEPDIEEPDTIIDNLDLVTSIDNLEIIKKTCDIPIVEEEVIIEDIVDEKIVEDIVDEKSDFF